MADVSCNTDRIAPAASAEVTPAQEPVTPAAPPAGRFPEYPASWYLFGETRELRCGPVSKELLGRRLVAFRSAGGRLAVLDARCAHLGADLGQGSVTGDGIRCPLHGWEYGPDGCGRVTGALPSPRLRCYPAVERHGLLFFFNGARSLFPLPFFPGADPNDFIPAKPFGAVLNCPWYMVGANAFDVQHFRGAHDRRLAGPPVVDCPDPFARRASAPFTVLGGSLRDRLTRWYGGDRVELSITDWCGNLMFVTASFRRTRSYGMLASRPLGKDRVFVQGVVFVRKSRRRLARLLLDPVHLRVRRYFIKEFLRPDAELAMRGIRYNPGSLLECDRELAQYFHWLASVSALASGPLRAGEPDS